MVELETWPPVWRPKQRLQGTGKVHKHVAHQEEPKQGRKDQGREKTDMKKDLSDSSLMNIQCLYRVTVYLHGEDGCDCIQGGNDDANLADASCEQQGPCGLSIIFTMSEHL